MILSGVFVGSIGLLIFILTLIVGTDFIDDINYDDAMKFVKSKSEEVISITNDIKKNTTFSHSYLDWETDFEKAKEIAQAAEKPILINFSANEWCGWCQKIDREILHTEEFKSWASKNVILFNIDTPRNYQNEPPENYEIKNQYSIRSFPSIVLIEPNGKELGRLGYSKVTPKVYTKEIEKIIAKYAEQHKKIETEVKINVEKKNDNGFMDIAKNIILPTKYKKELPDNILTGKWEFISPYIYNNIVEKKECSFTYTKNGDYDIQIKNPGTYMKSISGVYKVNGKSLQNKRRHLSDNLDYEFEVIDNNNIIFTTVPPLGHGGHSFGTYYFSRKLGNLKTQKIIEFKRQETSVKGVNEYVSIDKSKISSMVWKMKIKEVKKNNKAYSTLLARVILKRGRKSIPIKIKSDGLISLKKNASLGFIIDDTVKSGDFIGIDINGGDKYLNIEAKGYHTAKLTIEYRHGFGVIGDIILERSE